MRRNLGAGADGEDGERRGVAVGVADGERTVLADRCGEEPDRAGQPVGAESVDEIAAVAFPGREREQGQRGVDDRIVAGPGAVLGLALAEPAQRGVPDKAVRRETLVEGRGRAGDLLRRRERGAPADDAHRSRDEQRGGGGEDGFRFGRPDEGPFAPRVADGHAIRTPAENPDEGGGRQVRQDVGEFAVVRRGGPAARRAAVSRLRRNESPGALHAQFAEGGTEGRVEREALERTEEVGRGVRPERGARGRVRRLPDARIAGRVRGVEERERRGARFAQPRRERPVVEGSVPAHRPDEESDAPRERVPSLVLVGPSVVERREEHPRRRHFRRVAGPGTVLPLHSGKEAERARRRAGRLEGTIGSSLRIVRIEPGQPVFEHAPCPTPDAAALGKRGHDGLRRRPRGGEGEEREDADKAFHGGKPDFMH